ncbi:hypothetical protein WA026_011520 [Henosepilachna vigintioctopunctata]|uniref:NEDD8-activating enzyme E1 catalytic subunit n=1 Tax=Henosepilachna vigintioctopunctata TaxID=420089 RepID=A0AAW1TRF7_9CUCU
MAECHEADQKRWNNLRKVLERAGPFCHPEFEHDSDLLTFILTSCPILIIGAGGLGCELLKDLVLMGFQQIHIIDMDTIDLSNLNRQFLFRRKDIGCSKAEVAAAFINKRVTNCQIIPHFCKIQDKDESFYREFCMIVCGLDSIVARRWINGMLVSLLEYEDGVLKTTSIIPLVDGGTEGFKGNARVILPGMSACVECTLDLYPPQITYPLCTIANTPRLPEHCIEYAKVMLWPKENPFNVPLDGDDPQHTGWIYEKSLERALEFNIPGVTYRLVQGVIKNIIPAVASTNAVIAGICATEVFKIATNCYVPLKNYLVFNDVDGIYTYTYEAEKKENCLVCSQIPQTLTIPDPTKMKLKEIIALFTESSQYQMKSPGLTTMIDGKSKTLYMSAIKSIEERTRKNLNKTLVELDLRDGCEILVADATSPNTMVVRLNYLSADVEMK